MHCYCCYLAKDWRSCLRLFVKIGRPIYFAHTHTRSHEIRWFPLLCIFSFHCETPAVATTPTTKYTLHTSIQAHFLRIAKFFFIVEREKGRGKKSEFQSRNHHHKLNNHQPIRILLPTMLCARTKNANERMTQFYGRLKLCQINKMEK